MTSRTPLAAAALGACALLAMNAPPEPTTAASSPAAPPKGPVAAPQTRDERMAWWRDARFGMFIHFGLYSGPAGVWKGRDWPGAGEWLLNNAKADPIEYERTLVPQFNPTKFNAAEWAQIAKDAGMRYVVITTKHHDGFALWDSAVSDYDVMATPFKRDIMKELSDAVRAQGMTMCWYHSIMDWHHPDYIPRRGWDPRPVVDGSFPKYVDYMHAQLKELLTKYGPIGILWFDGEWESTWNHDWGKRTDDFVRSLQPGIIVNNRVDSGRAGMEGFSASESARGDYGTPEQTIPPNGMPGKDWETCMTMNDTWGYKASDTHWKSSQELIRMLCDIVSKGGNFLLNVGPKGDGTIPPESVERLRRMGEWMRVNGGAVYGTNASPFPRKFPWGRVSQKPGPTSGRESTTLNLMVFDWPADGRLLLPGIENEPMGVRVLGVDGAVDAGDGAVTLGGVRGNARARRTMQGIEIAGLPGTPPDPDASVVQLFIAGKPQVAPLYVTPDAEGVIKCMAADATLVGSIQYEGRYDNLGWWRDTVSTASWTVQVPRGRRFKVSLDYAANPACGGDVEVTVGSTVLRAALPGRSDWGDFGRVEVGEADIPAGKPVTITVRAERKPGEAFINLRDVRLVPTSVLGK